MASTAPLFQKSGEVSGGADTGYDLGSTDPDYTSKEMAIAGGMDTLPMADASVVATLPDLAPAELQGGGDTDTKTDRRKMYHVLKVKGASLPSANAKYVGSTPSAALNKAARRIFKKSGVKEFTVLMRRVSPKHAERELYQYDVTMVKAPKAEGFMTIVADTFTDTVTGTHENVDKKVRIVQASTHPVWGYLQEDGRAVKDAPANGFPLVRGAGTNTLTLVLPGAIPDSVQSVSVNKSEWDVQSVRSHDIEALDKAEFDTASHVKERESFTLQQKKEREAARRESAREKSRAEKVRLAEIKARESAREKARVAKVKLADSKARDAERAKAKKQREAAAAAAAKMRATKK
jgi:hypothetical protein